MMTEYTDFAEYYDYDHDISFDIPFCVDYAQECQSPVLELASGTGRLLIALAKAGFEVFRVDISDNMLDICRKAIHQQPFEQRVHQFRADMAHFNLPRKDFHLAFIALRSFMHLLSNSRVNRIVKLGLLPKQGLPMIIHYTLILLGVIWEMYLISWVSRYSAKDFNLTL